MIRRIGQWIRRHRVGITVTSLVLVTAFWFCLPQELFDVPYSMVITDQNGRLLQARISDDGQWRFPFQDSLPPRYKQALVQFEDQRFYQHPGVDFLALGRAVIQNAKAGKVVSGASTISMQVVRLSHGKRQRNLVWKMLEFVQAIRLECRYSKEEILQLYAGHAPFGGNVVGIGAASWRYFGRHTHELSWAELATLAVLPNTPSLMHPGRNRSSLKTKRDRLLDKLQKAGIIDAETNRLSKLETIPEKPLPLPQHAPHLLTSLKRQKISFQPTENQSLQTTLDLDMQIRVADLLFRHHQHLRANGINNAAALVMEVVSGNVLAYVGNVYQPDRPDFDSHVDVITAHRSPGSTLKPLLYEAMLSDGLILPKSLIPDVPTQIGGYKPQNFDLSYDGAVPASKALSRSLNIPAVRMLQQYRTERFHARLRHLGVSTITKPPGHYGLSLILGGGENSMWELAGIYASMGRVLMHHHQNNGRYNKADIHPPRIQKESSSSSAMPTLFKAHIFNSASVYHTLEAMEEVMRPGEELLWQQFASAQRIAWKTGTSFGFRDGWAIGLTPRYLVAVWVGNADGEGRPGLVGVETAAPVMFDIFRTLPPAPEWFQMPFSEMEKVRVCRKSGAIAHELCQPVDSVWIPKQGTRSAVCGYHQMVHLDAAGKHRVNSDCYPTEKMQHRPWFILPPMMEWYYKSRNPDYQTLPSFLDGCNTASGSAMMEMIYPKKSNRIFIPVELDGQTGKCIFEVAHRQAGTRIHWHLDEVFIGTTTEFHQMALSPPPGKHQLILVDDAGERLEQGFEIVGK